MKPAFFPVRAHLLACVGPSCARRGAPALFAAAWSRLESERLAYYARGGSIRFTQSGCLGACAFGPVLACYARDAGGALREAWYHDVTLPLVMSVARAAHEGRDVPAEHRFDALDDA